MEPDWLLDGTIEMKEQLGEYRTALQTEAWMVAAAVLGEIRENTRVYLMQLDEIVYRLQIDG